MLRLVGLYKIGQYPLKIYHMQFEKHNIYGSVVRDIIFKPVVLVNKDSSTVIIIKPNAVIKL